MESNDLQTLIATDRLEREKRALVKFNQFIETLRQEERCYIIPVMILRGGNVEASIEIKAID